MTTKTRLTVLALAAAVLTTGTALAGTATDPVLNKIRKPGEVITQKQVPTGGANAGTVFKKLPPGEIGTIIGKLPPGGTVIGSEPKPTGLGGNTIQPIQACIAGQPCNLPPKPTGLGGSTVQPVQACIAGQPCNLPPKPTGLGGSTVQPVQVCIAGQPCNLPKPSPIGGNLPVPFPPPHPPICPLDGHCDGPPRAPGQMGDGGHHDGDHGGYGYGWRERPEVVIEGAPAVVAVPAPVAMPAPVPAAAQPVATQEPCNCLTKQSLPDGSILFQDICTKQSALAPAPAAAAQ